MIAGKNNNGRAYCDITRVRFCDLHHNFIYLSRFYLVRTWAHVHAIGRVFRRGAPHHACVSFTAMRHFMALPARGRRRARSSAAAGQLGGIVGRLPGSTLCRHAYGVFHAVPVSPP